MLFNLFSNFFEKYFTNYDVNLQNAGSISAHFSFGQFLWPIPRLASQHTVSSRHGRQIISARFDHCFSALVFCCSEKLRCFAGTFALPGTLELP